MPIYTYRCGGCGHEFDLKQSFSAESEHPCPSCGKVSRRVIQPAAVIYKGSGFYTTDYARKSSNGASASTNGSSSGSSKGDTATTKAPSPTTTNDD